MSTDTIETERTEGGVFASIEDAVAQLHDSATVDRVYGEPITAEGKTIVPVARIAYGFGVGFGSGTDEESGEGGEGGGGGGGLTASPVGALEVTEGGTRFVRFADRRRLALAAGVGAVVGFLLGRR